MKLFTSVLLGCLALLAIDTFADQGQTNNREEAVVRAVLIAKEASCDKYCWYQIKVLKILKGAEALHATSKLRVAALSTDAGVPTQECTLHLERYNAEVSERWKLLGGTAVSGVSNVKTN